MFVHSELIFIKGFPNLGQMRDCVFMELAEFLDGRSNVARWSFAIDDGFESFIYPNGECTSEYHG